MFSVVSVSLSVQSSPNVTIAADLFKLYDLRPPTHMGTHPPPQKKQALFKLVHL